MIKIKVGEFIYISTCTSGHLIPILHIHTYLLVQADNSSYGYV